MVRNLTSTVQYTLPEPIGISLHRDTNHLIFFGEIGSINHGNRIALLLSGEEKNRKTIDLCMSERIFFSHRDNNVMHLFTSSPNSNTNSNLHPNPLTLTLNLYPYGYVYCGVMGQAVLKELLLPSFSCFSLLNSSSYFSQLCWPSRHVYPFAPRCSVQLQLESQLGRGKALAILPSGGDYQIA